MPTVIIMLRRIAITAEQKKDTDIREVPMVRVHMVGAAILADFGLMISFGGATQNTSTARPEEKAGDSEEIRSSIRYMNAGKYVEAQSVLARVVSSRRDARWNYLFALTSKGLGDDSRAMDFIGRALRMDPENRTYKMFLSSLRSSSQSFDSSGWSGGRSYVSPIGTMAKIALGIMAFQFISMMLRLLLLGF